MYKSSEHLFVDENLNCTLAYEPISVTGNNEYVMCDLVRGGLVKRAVEESLTCWVQGVGRENDNYSVYRTPPELCLEQWQPCCFYQKWRRVQKWCITCKKWEENHCLVWDNLIIVFYVQENVSFNAVLQGNWYTVLASNPITSKCLLGSWSI